MKFGITFDARDKAASEKAQEITKILDSYNRDIVSENRTSGLSKRQKIKRISEMDADIIISVGNSFNVLRTFKELNDRTPLVLCVAISQSNFLSEITADQFQNALERLDAGKYTVEERSRLCITGTPLVFPLALNDVVLASRKSATLVSYALLKNGREIFRDTGDGLIISTPTGSTGYSVSAGGPIVMPEAKTIVTTPISSLNQNKSIVFDNNDKIEIKSIYSSHGIDVIVDGGFRSAFTGTNIMIKKADVPARFIKFKDLDKSVLERLRKRIEISKPAPTAAPPSAKFIFKILEYEGPLTQKELIKTTSLPSRTVRSGLTYLIKGKLIGEQKSLRDSRYSIYYIIH